MLDITGQLRPPTVTDKVLQVRRFDPDQPSDFDGAKALARIRVGDVAPDLFLAHLQDLATSGIASSGSRSGLALP